MLGLPSAVMESSSPSKRFKIAIKAIVTFLWHSSLVRGAAIVGYGSPLKACASCSSFTPSLKSLSIFQRVAPGTYFESHLSNSYTQSTKALPNQPSPTSSDLSAIPTKNDPKPFKQLLSHNSRVCEPYQPHIRPKMGRKCFFTERRSPDGRTDAFPLKQVHCGSSLY